MRALISTALALALTTSSLSAAEVGPLSPGKPSGVHNANLEAPTGLLIVLGVAAVVSIVALASVGGGNNAAATATGPGTP
jgi:hypothetical protein